jgi:hypothetical protein
MTGFVEIGVLHQDLTLYGHHNLEHSGGDRAPFLTLMPSMPSAQ